MNAIHHDGTLLYDLDYLTVLTAAENWAYCCRCRDDIWMGEPERYGPMLAVLHRLVCTGRF